MTRHDWFLFIFTFLVGMCAGMYLYAMSFKPVYQPEGLSGSEIGASDFSITGRSYGGRQTPGYVHPSFRIHEDGTYLYVPGGSNADASAEPIEGTLPRDLFQRVTGAVGESDLLRLAKPTAKEHCNIYLDRPDYSYRITVDEREYEVDTCATALSYDDELAVALMRVWSYLDDPSAVRESEGGDASPIETWFKNQFDWQDEEPVACTAEAKICPDGSAVGRTGPNCEFAPCP